MMELARFEKTIKRMQSSLISSVDSFRKGEDPRGLDCFLNIMADMKILMDFYPFCEELREEMEKAVPMIQNMYGCMQNEDVVGMTDVLEFRLHPLIKEWA